MIVSPWLTLITAIINSRSEDKQALRMLAEMEEDPTKKKELLDRILLFSNGLAKVGDGLSEVFDWAVARVKGGKDDEPERASRTQ